ncbi:MAG: hypothetical protein J0665_19375 [Deltaproteobacteria bacterium]|nr:hypothetical protein [Deltaproteobacteria bacterium]
MRVQVFDHIHQQSLSFFHKTSTGEIISRILSDITLMQGAISNVVVGLLRDFFSCHFPTFCDLHHGLETGPALHCLSALGNLSHSKIWPCLPPHQYHHAGRDGKGFKYHP